jgi:regulator of sigma E protease
VGFGPKIFGWVKDGIEYRVSWIPFGGYVALPQMSPMDAIEGKSGEKAEPLPPVTPGSKILVALAGPVMNVALAFGLALVIWRVGLAVPVNPSIVGWIEPGSLEEQQGIEVGDRIVQINDRPVQTWMDVNRAVALSLEPEVNVSIERKGERKQYRLPTRVSEALGIKLINLYPQGRPMAGVVFPGKPAEQAGVQAGDKFLAIDGVPVSSAKELIELIGSRAGKPTPIQLLRRGKVVTLTATPEFDAKAQAGRIGVQLEDEMDFAVQRPGPTPGEQFGEVFGMLSDSLYALLHYKKTGVGVSSFSGPVGIAGGWWYEIRHGGLTRGMKFAVLINLALAVFNLLPIPILDGGHILLAVLEKMRRRPLNAKLVYAASTACAALLISFMLLVTVFDFKKLLPRSLKPSSAPLTNEPATETNQP